MRRRETREANLTIRLAAENDISAMQEIEIDAGRRFVDVGFPSIANDDPMPAATLREHIETGTAWIAVDERNRSLGYAIGSAHGTEGHLDQVSVRVDAGENGVGRALIQAVCAWAASQGFPTLSLTTFRDVPFNGPLYGRLGFNRVREADWTPELRAVRARERGLGIDVAPRVVLRLDLTRHPPNAILERSHER